MAVPKMRGCRLLLGALIALLAAFPALTDLARPGLLVAVVASVFVVGVVVVRPGRRHVRAVVALAVFQFAFTIVEVLLNQGSTPHVAAIGFGIGITAILIVYCIVCVLQYVLQSDVITHDQVYAGICVYLMLGFAFGSIYYLLNILSPGGFAINSAKLEADPTPDMMYFSFITLATLGYGDITPVARPARILAEFEALAGTLYMAVFMARLVSQHLAGGGRKQGADGREAP